MLRFAAPATTLTTITTPTITRAITITGFPSETIYKHLEFYWPTTLTILKRFVEAER